jgi:signal peptidase I
MRSPVDRMTESLPSPWPTIIDWIVTIVVAVGAVLAIKQWVVNPYRIPSASMEPTLHCAEPMPGCLSGFSDRVLANRFIYRFRDPERGEIVVFETPQQAFERCGAGGTFVKRIVGLPGDQLVQRNPQNLGRDFERTLRDNQYFMMGDNRTSSCDSRDWGPVTREALIGPVFAVYWPPQRIGFR